MSASSLIFDDKERVGTWVAERVKQLDKIVISISTVTRIFTFI